jgi:nucleotide-binding universal stress UspA family protein
MDTQHDRRTVVVGVDGSEDSLRAVRWAAVEAGRRHVPLRLVHAFGWGQGSVVGHPELGKRYRDTLMSYARDQLGRAAEVATAQLPGIDVEQQLEMGSPMAVLHREARHAQVLVLGDRGVGRIEGLLLGSVAAAMGAHAACPVVVVRGVERAPSEAAALPVVVGVDGTATSDAAVAFAFETAADLGVSVVAVHSWWEPIFDSGLSAMILDWDAIQAGEVVVLAQRLAAWTAKYPEVVVERQVIRDDPTRGLLAQAAHAQLVVIGSRGRGEFSSLVLGSVGHALMHRSPCPVAIVRADAD